MVQKKTLIILGAIVILGFLIFEGVSSYFDYQTNRLRIHNAIQEKNDYYELEQLVQCNLELRNYVNKPLYIHPNIITAIQSQFPIISIEVYNTENQTVEAQLTTKANSKDVGCTFFDTEKKTSDIYQVPQNQFRRIKLQVSLTEEAQPFEPQTCDIILTGFEKEYKANITIIPVLEEESFFTYLKRRV